MDKIFIFLICCCLGTAKIRINRLVVPESVEYKDGEDVVLDCDFDSGGEVVSEVKWFLDGLDHQIYQWLPGYNKKGQAIGKLKDHIDADYKATEDDKTMYRALHILNVIPELSGNYSCKVSGIESEDVQTKRMIIYKTPDSDLELDILEDNRTISCSVSGIYPEANMTVYITNDNRTDIIYRQDEESVENDENGNFNISSFLVYPENFTGSFYYTCELNIPGTRFSVNETGGHFPESSSLKQAPSFELLLTLLTTLLSLLWL